MLVLSLQSFSQQDTIQTYQFSLMEAIEFGLENNYQSQKKCCFLVDISQVWSG